MQITGFLFGGIAGLFSIGLWIVFIFYNPYTTSSFDDTAIYTFLMLCLPACLAIIAAFTKKKYNLFIAFLWSLPISL